MVKNISEIIGNPIIFLEKIFTKLREIELNVEDFEIDHLCYRVQTASEYQLKKEEISLFGGLLVESIINGRLISTFKLYDPILFKKREIFLLELPSPKVEQAYQSGLEHLEFVCHYPLQEIIDRNPHLFFETQGLNKAINADITLRLEEFCIRFHNQSLEKIIKLEKNLSEQK